MAEETHRALGAMVVQAKGASAAAAASRYVRRCRACDVDVLKSKVERQVLIPIKEPHRA